MTLRTSVPLDRRDCNEHRPARTIGPRYATFIYGYGMRVWRRTMAVDLNESSERPGEGALAGVRVIDCTDYIAGPYAGMMLADLGADVIKVEPLEGDRWRQQAPIAPGESRNF